MSGNTTPAPPTLGSLAVEDDDWRYLDFSALASYGDSIATVDAITIGRADGSPSQTGDLSANPADTVQLSNGNLRATFWLVAGTTQDTFLITLTITTAQGRQLNRSAYISVVGALG